MINAVAKQWKRVGIILHSHRGREGLSCCITQNRLGLLQRGHKVMS